MVSPQRSNQLEMGLSVQDLVAWIESLEDTDEAHQHNIIKFNDAVYDLVQYGNESHDLLLTKLQPSNNSWIQWGAIWVLTETKATNAIEPIWNLYEMTNDLRIQFYTLQALSIFKDVRVLKPAINLIKEGRNRLGILILGNLGDERGLYFLAQLLREIKIIIQDSVKLYEMISKYDEFNEILPRAKTKLREKSMIIQALSNIGGERSVKLLKDIIYEEQVYVQQLSQYQRLKVQAIYALFRINHPDVISILENAKTHKQYGVRNAARKLLKQV